MTSIFQVVLSVLLIPSSAQTPLFSPSQVQQEKKALPVNTQKDPYWLATRMLDAIKAMLEGHATKDQQLYEINNRPLSRIPTPELIALRDRFDDLVKTQKAISSVIQQNESKIVSPKTVESRPELLYQTGHFGAIKTVSLSSDGRFLISGAEDNSIKLWEVSTGRELRTFFGESGWSTEGIAALSPDGNYLAIAAGSFISLREVETGRDIPFLMSSDTGAITALAFSSNGKWLVAGSWGGGIILREMSSGYTHTFAAHSGLITSIAIGPDSRWFASASTDRTIKLWELDTIKSLNRVAANIEVSKYGAVKMELSERLDFGKTGKNILTLLGHSDSINSIALAPNSSWLASTSSDGSIKLWDVRSGQELRTLATHSPQTKAITISPDNRWIATAGTDKLIKLWDAGTGQEIRSFAGHDELVTTIKFGPDGNFLASGSQDRTVKLWNVATGDVARTFTARISIAGVAAFSANGRWLVSGSAEEKSLYVWEVSAGLERRRLPAFSSTLGNIALSQDGHWLVAGDKDKTIKLWDLSRDAEARVLVSNLERDSKVAISPNSDIIAYSAGSYTIKLLELSTGRELRTLNGPSASNNSRSPNFVGAMAFSPDGSLLASSAGWDKKIILWDIAKGREVHTLVGREQPVLPGHIVAIGGISTLAFNPNGNLLASAGGDRTVTVWNLTTGRELFRLGGSSINISKILFDPNGRFVAALSRYLTENVVTVWDLASGNTLSTFHLSSANILDLAISADGRRLITGSRDGTRIWDTDTGVLLATLVSLRNTNDWLVITPEGLFDGSPLGWNQILWRLDQNIVKSMPIESYFNDFFYPGLLQDIMQGKRLMPPAGVDLSKTDRRLPTIALASQTNLSGPVSTRTITISVEISENTDKPKNSRKPDGSGAQDVRLFRNGSLVKVWRGDVFRLGEKDRCTQQGKGKIICFASVPVVAGANQFTANVFNRENVKSEDATLIITGAESLRRKGTAYIVAIGINEYANVQYNLKYAIADAESFSSELKRQQEQLKIYEHVEVIPLFNEEATKENIIRTLTTFYGRAQPEDAVIIYFAGHGTTQNERFYLIPHDLGYMGSRTLLNESSLRTILDHSISDKELERAFEPLDLSKIVFIIDACNSGQALETEEKRRGPMNSKGLAQLAYEKGMYILTAAQSYQAALEVTQLGHGLLTYTLIEEGIKTGVADVDPRDGRIWVREWFDYASDGVPKLQEEMMNAAQKRGANLAFVEGEDRELIREKRNLQRPRLFYRRELEVQSFLVAQTEGGKK